MKGVLLTTMFILGIMSVYGFAQMGGHGMQGMMGGQSQQQPNEQTDGGQGGMMGGQGGMMGGQGGMMGGQGGMMGGQGGMQQQQPQEQPQYQQQLQKPLEEKDARTIVENYLKTSRNPNLKLGKVKDLDYAFEAEIVTKENSLVDKIIIDKKTGWMRSAY